MPPLKFHVPTVMALSVLLAACATPDTDYPEFTKAQITAKTIEAQRSTIEAYLALEQRVDDIAWPLLVGNADLCHERTREGFGMTLGNATAIRDLVDGFTLEQVRAVGYDDAPIVLQVSAGSPAALAGVKPGARPVRIGDEDMNGSMEKLIATVNAYKALQEKAEDADGALDVVAKPLRVTFEQDGESYEVKLNLETFCDIPVSVAQTNAINASASGSSVRIYRGLLNYFPDNDDAIGVIVGHEIGHVIGRHVPKQRRNSMVSGFALWGLPLTVGASLVDSLVAGPLERWAGVETPPGAAGVTRLTNRALGTRSFEQEADYLGLYIAARGGLDISKAEEVFEGFAKVSPRSTYGNRSHPVTPQRVLAVQATRAEIKAKQAAGEALVPNGWPYPVSLEEDSE